MGLELLIGAGALGRAATAAPVVAFARIRRLIGRNPEAAEPLKLKT
jgi:hypothetical protein